jgi:hypothetical protein
MIISTHIPNDLYFNSVYSNELLSNLWLSFSKGIKGGLSGLYINQCLMTCPICREEEDCDFITRCKQEYHLDCVSDFILHHRVKIRSSVFYHKFKFFFPLLKMIYFIMDLSNIY